MPTLMPMPWLSGGDPATEFWRGFSAYGDVVSNQQRREALAANQVAQERAAQQEAQRIAIAQQESARRAEMATQEMQFRDAYAKDLETSMGKLRAKYGDMIPPEELAQAQQQAFQSNLLKLPSSYSVPAYTDIIESQNRMYSGGPGALPLEVKSVPELGKDAVAARTGPKSWQVFFRNQGEQAIEKATTLKRYDALLKEANDLRLRINSDEDAMQWVTEPERRAKFESSIKKRHERLDEVVKEAEKIENRNNLSPAVGQIKAAAGVPAGMGTGLMAAPFAIPGLIQPSEPQLGNTNAPMNLNLKSGLPPGIKSIRIK